MTFTNGNGNANGDTYVRPNFLSDAVRGREIDGSSWFDEVRGTWHDLFRKPVSYHPGRMLYADD
jgi:hypothetical protein